MHKDIQHVLPKGYRSKLNVLSETKFCDRLLNIAKEIAFAFSIRFLDEKYQGQGNFTKLKSSGIQGQSARNNVQGIYSNICIWQWLNNQCT